VIPTLTIANISVNQCSGPITNGCWKQSETARPGEVVAVQVYYKNTSNSIATNVVVGMSPTSFPTASAVVFAGGVGNTPTNRAVGTVNLSLTTPSTVTLIPGTAKWFYGSTTTGYPVNESALFSGNGFSIGDLAPGAQGVITANFRVGQNQTTAQCSDGIDNDNDGRVDYAGGDQSCYSASDTTEDTYDVQQTCTATLNASTYSISSGNPVVLSWSTSNLSNLNIYPTVGSVGTSGSYTVYPTSSTVYTLSGYGCGSTTTRTVTVNVNQNQNYQCNDGIDNDNDGRVDYAGGDQSCYSYTDNTEDTYDNNNTTCNMNFYSSASNSYVNSGSAVTLSWDSVNISNLSIYPNVGSVSSIGSTTVYPTVNTTYTLSGYGCGNTYNRTVSVYVNGGSSNQNLPQAVTTVATILSTTQARLNGVAVPNTTYGSATAWFEWGTTGYLGNKTNTQTVNGSSSSNNYISDVVGNLVPGTWYYYRTVVQNQYGLAYGDIVRFNTQPNTTVKVPTTVVDTTSKSEASLLELKVENTYERACVENIVDYTITYKNISKQTLKDAVLTFTNPKEITYISSSKGKYQVVDRTLTIDVGDIAPGATGSVIVHGRINSDAKEGNLLVSTSTIVYTNSVTKAQEDAIAYSLITEDKDSDCPNTNLLGGDTSGFWSFLPNTLVEWLLLILVILGLIVLGRNLYSKKV
jgi:hypothetical protein